MEAPQQTRVSMEDLQAIAVHAREATDADAVDGVTPSFVVEPESAQEASEVLKLATEAGLKVSPRGSGTKLGWGNPPQAVDVVLSSARMNELVEHAAGDLVTVVGAGMKLEDLQKELSGAGQMLALDPPEDGATLGGIVAANASGPRRLRYGTVRDLLIGITVVLSNGTVAKAGGKVVKNVAGYDLGKLFTGSLGTLGFIAQTTWRLHPVPAASRSVAVEAGSPEAARDAVQALMHSTIVPTMIEAHREDDGACMVAVMVEGIEPGVVAQSEAALELLSPHGEARILGDEVGPFWDETLKIPWSDGDVGLKVGALPGDLGHVLRAVEEVAGGNGLSSRVLGHAATGVSLVGLSGGDEAGRAAAVRRLREVVVRREGSVVVQHAPAELRREVDAWGPVGDSLPLMRRVKERFDPGNTMNPGRFVGGI